jgi:hypothetical protein
MWRTHDGIRAAAQKVGDVNEILDVLIGQRDRSLETFEWM